jgi:hypothetical protein
LKLGHWFESGRSEIFHIFFFIFFYFYVFVIGEIKCELIHENFKIIEAFIMHVNGVGKI